MEVNPEFWKYDGWFPSDVSRLTSVWNRLNLSLKYWCIEARLDFYASYGPKKLSKCHLGTIQTTFSEDSNYYRGNYGENLFLSSLKMLYFRGSLPKSVLTAQKKTAVKFSKWPFFQNSLVISWATLLGKMQVKNWIFFLNFSLVKFFNLLESYFLRIILYFVQWIYLQYLPTYW